MIQTNLILRRIKIASLCAGLSVSSANASTEEFADALRYSLLVGASGVSIYKNDYVGLQKFAWELGITSAATLSIKHFVDAERPNGEDRDSFPSGHAATSFSAAAYLHSRYGWKLGLPAGVVAGWVAASRVNTRHHRWGDVIAGAAIALLVNRINVRSYSDQHPSITMRYHMNGIYVGGNWRF